MMNPGARKKDDAAAAASFHLSYFSFLFILFHHHVLSCRDKLCRILEETAKASDELLLGVVADPLKAITVILKQTKMKHSKLKVNYS